MEAKNRSRASRTDLTHHGARNARTAPRRVRRDLGKRPTSIASDTRCIHCVLRHPRPALQQDRGDLCPKPAARGLRALIGRILTPSDCAEATQRLKLDSRAAEQRASEAYGRLWGGRSRPRDERKTTMSSTAPEPHQERFEDIIGLVCEEHSARIRLYCACFKSRQPQPSRTRRNAAAMLRRVHMHRLQRNAKCGTQPRTMVGIRIRVRTAQMVMHMNRTRQSHSVSAAGPRPCAHQQRSGVRSPAQRNDHTLAAANGAALMQGCPCFDADARTAYAAAQSAIRGVHGIMLRRCEQRLACDSISLESSRAAAAGLPHLSQRRHRARPQ